MDSIEEPQKKVFKARKTMRVSDRQQLDAVYKVKEELLKTDVKLLNGNHENGDVDPTSPLENMDYINDKDEVNGLEELCFNPEKSKSEWKETPCILNVNVKNNPDDDLKYESLSPSSKTSELNSKVTTEPAPGDPPSGDLATGDLPASGDMVSEVLTSDDPTSSDPTSSDPTSGDATSGVPTSDEPASSDPASGDPASGETVSDKRVFTENSDMAAGQHSIELVSGELMSGEPVSGELVSSEPVPGELVSSEPISSDPVSDNSASDDPASGTLASDDAASGDLASGGPACDDLTSGDQVSGDLASGDLIPDEPTADKPTSESAFDSTFETSSVPVCVPVPDTDNTEPSSNKGDDFLEQNGDNEKLDEIFSFEESKKADSNIDASEETLEAGDTIVCSAPPPENEKVEEDAVTEPVPGEEDISSSMEIDQSEKNEGENSTDLAETISENVIKDDKNENILENTDSMETDEIIPILEKLAPAEDELTCFSKTCLLPIDETNPDLEEKMESSFGSPSKQESSESLPKEAFLVLSDEEDISGEKDESEAVSQNESCSPG